ncbi:hypothetical protein ACHAQA_003202 [Verticillium albo-atrum]
MAGFQAFPRLPAELRIKIWALAVPRRIVALEEGDGQDDFRSPTPPPALTQTCHESRNLGLYTRAFYSSDAAYIWISFAHDTIHFACASLAPPRRTPPHAADIRHLATTHHSDYGGWLRNRSGATLQRFPALESFDLADSTGLHRWTGFIAEANWDARLRAMVRIVDLYTGFAITEATSAVYHDWYETHVARRNEIPDGGSSSSSSSSSSRGGQTALDSFPAVGGEAWPGGGGVCSAGEFHRRQVEMFLNEQEFEEELARRRRG